MDLHGKMWIYPWGYWVCLAGCMPVRSIIRFWGAIFLAVPCICNEITWSELQWFRNIFWHMAIATGCNSCSDLIDSNMLDSQVPVYLGWSAIAMTLFLLRRALERTVTAAPGGSDAFGRHAGDGDRWRLAALASCGHAWLALPRGAGNSLASWRWRKHSRQDLRRYLGMVATSCDILHQLIPSGNLT